MTELQTIKISTVKELLADNDFFKFEESSNFIEIKDKSGNGDYTIYKQNIEFIYLFNDLVDQKRIGFSMKNGAYLYFNLTKKYVSASI